MENLKTIFFQPLARTSQNQYDAGKNSRSQCPLKNPREKVGDVALW
jgi:hypothetical protein